MSDMSLQETIERFSEGLKKASSRARELGKAQHNKDWDKISIMLDGLRIKGQTFYEGRALGRQESLKMLDIRQASLNVKDI